MAEEKDPPPPPPPAEEAEPIELLGKCAYSQRRSSHYIVMGDDSANETEDDE